MPDRYDYRNLLGKAYDVAAEVQDQNGEDAPDEVSFVMGFMACFGIITNRVDVGLEGAPMDKVLDAIHRDLVDFGRGIADSQPELHRMRMKFNGG